LARRALVRRRTGPPPPRAAANGANDAPDATTTTQHGLVVDEAAAPSSSATNSDVTTPTPTTKKPRFARLVEAPPSGAPGPAGEQPRSAAVPLPSTPPELEGLVLTESGDLIDAATGKPLPALGEPSRFDIKCAALRGDLDPPAWRPNTERAPAPLVAALLGPFPLDYEFNVVAKKTSPDQCPEALANELAAIVHSGAACPGPAPTTATTTTTAAEGGAGATKTTPLVTFKERMGGKFVSVCVTARVRSADLLEEGFAALAKDARVVMRY
jgi:hypothetical protein